MKRRYLYRIPAAHSPTGQPLNSDAKAESDAHLRTILGYAFSKEAGEHAQIWEAVDRGEELIEGRVA